MIRAKTAQRKNWNERLQEQGLVYNDLPDGSSYWTEGVYYRFTREETTEIEITTGALWELCLDTVQKILDNRWLYRLKIPDWVHPLIERSWEEEPPSIYGRFDLICDGKKPPKLLEFNADTPTSLFESAIIQWEWMEDVLPGYSQSNYLHEALIEKWKELKKYLKGDTLHLACVDYPEDIITISYIQDTANQAGLNTVALNISDISWDNKSQIFVDKEYKPIKNLFKLYPWEWLVLEEFGQYIPLVEKKMFWIEPIWKMVLANKAFLAILWELNKNHPNLLETYIDDPCGLTSYVKKPVLSREGANIKIVKDGHVIEETSGDYGAEGYIYQQYAEIPDFDGWHPVIGSWLIDGYASGIGIRETNSRITTNTSNYVPHVY